jgi:DNA-binding NarL/FixJ family response regulator
LSHIRILIGAMPRMLRDILEEAIGTQPDMELVGSSQAADLLTAIEREQPDVVIVTQEGTGLNVARVELAAATRPLGVLVVTAAGRQIRLAELKQISVSDASSNVIVETIRASYSHHNDP